MNTLRNHPNLVRTFEAATVATIFALGGAACTGKSGATPNTPTTAASAPAPGEQLPSCTIGSQADAVTAREENLSLNIQNGEQPGEWDVSKVTYDFGDGSKPDNNGNENSESHTYVKAGTYKVTANLVMEAAPGVSDLPKAIYDGATFACTPLNVTVQ